MDMSTAFLLAGLGFGVAGIWLGTLSWVIGTYYIICYVGSKLLGKTMYDGPGYHWYVFFVVIDLALGSWLRHKGYGGTVPFATTLLVFMACVSAYAGANRGFLYEYYPAIGGVVNTIFIVLIGHYIWTHR